MQESGEITAMKIKWWKEKRGGGACTDTAEDSGAEELTVANVGGVFVVLISGGGVAIIVSTLEMLYSVKNRANELEVYSSFTFLFRKYFNVFLHGRFHFCKNLLKK